MVPQRETGLPSPVLCYPPASTSQQDPENRAQTYAREASPLHQIPSLGLDFPIGNSADSDTVSCSEREDGEVKVLNTGQCGHFRVCLNFPKRAVGLQSPLSSPGPLSLGTPWPTSNGGTRNNRVVTID